MADMSWKEAIVKVLTSSTEPMHYTDIAQAIADTGLRLEVGATPAATVAATITISHQNEGDSSPFVRVSRGYYSLRSKASAAVPIRSAVPEEPDEAGFINAFGMYWSRSGVLWASSIPKILGKQLATSTVVDFCAQKGVYLLHDGRAVVYVGRTTDQPLGVRMRQHLSDRLNGRWNRFSWFGIYPVNESGVLETAGPVRYDLEMLIATMEALLIEGLEPPQNRKRGDDFTAVEFLQVVDPEIAKKQIIELMDEWKKKL